MIGGIAGQGGFDTKGKQTRIASTDTTSSATVVNITGSGYLMSVGYINEGLNNNISITIDGTSKYSGVWVVNGAVAYGMTFIFRFESSLNISFSTASGAHARCSVVYVLD